MVDAEVDRGPAVPKARPVLPVLFQPIRRRGTTPAHQRYGPLPRVWSAGEAVTFVGHCCCDDKLCRVCERERRVAGRRHVPRARALNRLVAAPRQLLLAAGARIGDPKSRRDDDSRVRLNGLET